MFGALDDDLVGLSPRFSRNKVARRRNRHTFQLPLAQPCMNADYLNTLLGFHYWARDRVINAADTLSAEQYARPMGNSFSSVRDTLNHTYLAEWIWYSRWNGVSPTSFPNDEIPDVASLQTRWAELERNVRTYLATASDLNRVFAYRMMSGKEAESPLWQMVAHVVNHATYHRGQVTTLIRQLGAKPPPSTDMIFYFRELAVS
jgi:uncharacterized damage-inducible protein DinB